MNLDKNKVLLLMSGGIDSSVSAKVLLDRGFKVIGMTMEQLNLTKKYFTEEELNTMCADAVKDAKKVCDMLGIEHYAMDFSEQFKKDIIDNFVDEYMSGRTPNPCARCNPMIKWDLFLKEADKLGCYYIATGHYSRIRFDEEANRYVLFKGLDASKDQSYVKWGLTQDQLARTIFPLGETTKVENRKLAKEINLPVFNSPESQDICFISDSYHDFLEKIEPKSKAVGEGNIMLGGKPLGKHKGYPFYTVGQRKGLGVSHSEPLYVKSIDAKHNVIEVVTKEGMGNMGLIATDVNLIKYASLEEEKLFSVKIRYNDRGRDAYCKTVNGELHVRFIEPRDAITPGQSVVLFEGDDVVGGGVIDRTVD